MRGGSFTAVFICLIRVYQARMYCVAALSPVHLHSRLGFWNEIKSVWNQASRTQKTSVERTSSWKPTSSSASQAFPHILRNPKVYHRVRKSRPLVLILSQIIPTPRPQFIIRSSALISHSHQSLCLASGPLPSGFSSKTLYTSLTETKGHFLSNRNCSIGYRADVRKITNSNNKKRTIHY